MKNLKNYYMYADYIKNRVNIIPIYVPEITLDNIDDHINAIFNILKDGIETDYVHNLKINVSWGGDKNCNLFIIDYWYNLFMWKMVLVDHEPILPKHIFWSMELKTYHIKDFIDKFILTKTNKIKFNNEFLNENIYNGLWPFSYIEHFAYYLACTINNEDNIALMNASPEFYNLMHFSMANTPFEQVKDKGMEITNKVIDIIKDSKDYLGYEHGLAASFKASEAINPRQFKESVLNIGTKPDGKGGIYPYVIDSNFMNGGINNPVSYFIESSAARTAQILSKHNIGDSGDFARILGLNNTDTILNKDMNYECYSQNFVKFIIKTKKHLSMIKNRYYRFNPKGIEYLIDENDESLIGKTIYLRSPITCSSKHSICKKCYGDLYYTNYDINIGKIASEILSSQLTQILLSAKHLLETKISTIKWSPEFNNYFDLDVNSIKLTDLSDDINLSKYFIVIDPSEIYLESDGEDSITISDDNEIDDEKILYNEYIDHFILKTPTGDIYIGSEDNNPLYLSTEFNNVIRKKAFPDEGKALIPLSALVDKTIFYIKIINNEISKTMYDIIALINKVSVTENLTKDECLQNLVDLVIDHITIDAVHLEVILSNQIVDANNPLQKPNWNNPYVQYKMLSLDHALVNNPSVIISLLYKDLAKVLYNPLTYQKNKPSFFDLFFFEQPQNYIRSDYIDPNPNIVEEEKGIKMAEIVKK